MTTAAKNILETKDDISNSIPGLSCQTPEIWGQERQYALDELTVLFLDCQATAANPEKGQILEIGWIKGTAALDPKLLKPQSHLIQQPQGSLIPQIVSKLTGISESHLAEGVSEKEAWQNLVSSAEQVAAVNQQSKCPLVIHYARYELPFLRRLHEIAAPYSSFPFQVICTHAIASRLFPELPRRSLRALSGYLGHGGPEMRRSADHAQMTLSIWKCLVPILQSRCGINTLPTLKRWLVDGKPSGKTKRAYPINPDARRHLPDKPGIYRMCRTNGDILYVGKAKSLRKRVNSYFRNSTRHAEHILEMLTQARKLDFTTTASALEAAVMEADEIKRHCPPYNVALHPRGQSLVYFNRDLLRTSSSCNGEFQIGPFPAGRSNALVIAFAKWLGHNVCLSDEIIATFGIAMARYSSAHSIDPECVKKGLYQFRSRHLGSIKRPSPLRILASLGALLWRQSLQAAECEAPSDTEHEESHEILIEQRALEPADVASLIEGMVADTAHKLRRARWFQLILNSSIAWAGADAPRVLKHLLVIENGIIVERCTMILGKDISDLPQCKKSMSERPMYLDLATYDRLRVITTELRRLVCVNRTVELRLSSKINLRTDQLKKAFQWV